MRTALTRSAARTSAYAGPNWRGVGRVDVDAHMHGIEPGATLLVDFDRRDVTAGGMYLVDIGGWPELVQFRPSPHGLRAQFGGRWQFVRHAERSHFDVIGRLVRISQTSL